MDTHPSPSGFEHVDVLVVGAGISGIGTAYYLQRDLPSSSYLILEARGVSGGTWDLFRYPGIRSDSDLYTFGYAFEPWQGDSIAAGGAILDYLRDVARSNGIEERIRYHRKVVSAAWSSADARWLVEVERTDTGEREQLTCGWILSASGYYDHDQGFTPDLPGRQRFEEAGGTVVHPQHWPEDLDTTGLRVIVVGSGATAVTLVPALAGTAAHVTMLQRSPSYVVTAPAVDRVALALQKLLPDRLAHTAIRRKNIAQQRVTFRLCRRYPRAARRLLRWLTIRQLPAGFPVDEHFKPAYDPWDQRLCAVPDGDLFKAISAGTASVVTDHVETFTETGILLRSGQHLDADIVVTATGLQLRPLGGLRLVVDEDEVDVSEKVAYRGLMLSDVPNLAFVFGYFFSSWTLKVELLGTYVTALLTHMEQHDLAECRPRLSDPGMATRGMLDLDAGYVQRAAAAMPRQGTAFPWLAAREYLEDVQLVRGAGILEPHLHFTRTPAGQRSSLFRTP